MSSYILDLRKQVGHRPLLQTGAGVLVENAKGQILLQKRADNHCWSYAGGSAELDEEIEDTARRELLEETGLIAGPLELFGVFSGKDLHYVYPNGDEVSNIDIVFLCRSYDGELRCQESEVEDLQFFDPDALPEPISPPVKKVLQKWLRSKNLPVPGEVPSGGGSQRQRALSGKLFDAHCPELTAMKHRTHNLCQDYNATREDDPHRQELIRQIVGSMGEGSFFQGPIQFNYGCNTTVGSHCYFNFNLTVLDDAPIVIGDHVMIAPNVSLMASSHPLLREEREQLTYPDGHVSMSEIARGITIGSHVWIAAGSIVCGGVTIGEGAVIAAGSVVTKDIPAGWLAWGNPCRPVRPITEADSRLALL